MRIIATAIRRITTIVATAMKTTCFRQYQDSDVNISVRLRSDAGELLVVSVLPSCIMSEISRDERR